MNTNRGCLGYLQDQEDAKAEERKKKQDWVEIENSDPGLRAGDEFDSPEAVLRKLKPGHGVIVEIFNPNNGHAATCAYSHAWKLNYLGVDRLGHQIATALWHYRESRNELFKEDARKHGVRLGILENELDYYVIIRKNSKGKPTIRHILDFDPSDEDEYTEDILRRVLGMNPKNP